MNNTEQLRTTILDDEDKISSRRRFGLFSHPAPIAVGDDGEYKTKKHAKGSDGKPMTAPKQMLAGTCRSGVIKTSYIEAPQSIYINDNFKQQYKRQWDSDRKYHTKAKFHERQFVPSSGHKTYYKPIYDYIQQNPSERPPVEKDETGKVRTKSTNVLVNPCSKIQTNLLKKPRYMQDEYERERQLRNREREMHKKKMPDSTFKGMSHGNRAFSADKQVYGEDDEAQSVLSSRRMRRAYSSKHINKYKHENRFKLARRGHGDPIGKYPEFVERKTSEIIEKKLNKQKQGKQTWKYNNFGYSKPSPSITFHPQNVNLGRYR